MTEQAGWEWKALEQFGRIKSALISSRTLQERLTTAAVEAGFLEPGMVPEERQQALQGITERLTRTEPQGDEGKFAASIAAMSGEERQQLAGDLLDLWCECHRAWREDPPA